MRTHETGLTPLSSPRCNWNNAAGSIHCVVVVVVVVVDRPLFGLSKWAKNQTDKPFFSDNHAQKNLFFSFDTRAGIVRSFRVGYILDWSMNRSPAIPVWLEAKAKIKIVPRCCFCCFCCCCSFFSLFVVLHFSTLLLMKIVSQSQITVSYDVLSF